MNNQKYYRVDFTSFPRVWGVINIPENFVVYRSGTRAPLLSTDPRFFSDFPTAKTYELMMNGSYKTYGCCLKDVKLMDLRTLRYLFWEYVGYNRLWFSDDELLLVKKALFALGLMSLDDQYQFIKAHHTEHTGLEGWLNKYSSIEEVHYDIECSMGDEPHSMINRDKTLEHYNNFGNRISETSIDDEVVALLKSIFGDTIDGYIAPTFDTVWHDFRFNPELCLFDPSACIKFCTEVPPHVLDPDRIVPPIELPIIVAGLYKNIAGSDYVKGGGSLEGKACRLRNDVPPKEDSNFANERDTSDVVRKVEAIWKSKPTRQDQSISEVPMKNIYEGVSSKGMSKSNTLKVSQASQSGKGVSANALNNFG